MKIKQGFYLTNFLDSHSVKIFSNIAVFMQDDAEFIAYTSLPGRLSGGRVNELIVRENEVLRRKDNTRIDSLDNIINATIATIKSLNENGIPVEIALTNHYADDHDLQDSNLMKVLDAMAEAKSKNMRQPNGVIYVNDKVANTVRTCYGNSLTLTVSVIKFYERPDYSYQEALADAEFIVITPQDTFNREELLRIPQARRKDSYFIINSGCRLGCSNEAADRHYRAVSKTNRDIPSEIPRCFYSSCFDALTISPDYILELSAMGFNAFKIGRYDSNMQDLRLILDCNKQLAEK